MIKNLLFTILTCTLSTPIYSYYDNIDDIYHIDNIEEIKSYFRGFLSFNEEFYYYQLNSSYRLGDEPIGLTYDTGIFDGEIYFSILSIDSSGSRVVLSDEQDMERLIYYRDSDRLELLTPQITAFTFDFIDLQFFVNDFDTLVAWPLLAYTYQDISSLSYRFNNNINYNAPYNKTRAPYITIDYNAGLPRWDKTINLGYFISNNTIYTEMTMVYKRIDGAYPTYFTNNQSTGLVGGEEGIFKGAEGLYYASELIYYNRYTQLSTRVWLRNDTYLGDKYVIANGGTWINSNYTSFTILGDFVSFNEGDKANVLEVLGLFNDGSFTSVTPPSSEVTSVFDLLGKAFNSLGGILNITIFPGITLGLLLCIPFFGLVLLFIIGLFKR